MSSLVILRPKTEAKPIFSVEILGIGFPCFILCWSNKWKSIRLSLRLESMETN